LADGQTSRVVFKLAPGDYVGTIFRDKAVTEQEFEIHGSGLENTFIKGSATWDATIGDVLSFRDFIRITIQDCTIACGKYGLYTRDCLSVTVQNCRFYQLGSSGVNHGFNRTEAQMATDWASRGTAGSNRSDGGAMRIRAAPYVWVDGCEVYQTLRGLRIQDCGVGGSCRITNCKVDSSLESAYYCAAGTYKGDSGTQNMFISNCRADNIFHQGFLVIGGANVTISGCQAVNCASSAVVGWHTQDLRVVGCTFDECTSKTFIGIGSPGDSYGCVYFSSKLNLTTTGGYMLTALNNSMTRCGQGRAATIVGFYFGDFDTSVSSYRAIIDNNNLDAATAVYKASDPIPLVNTAYPQHLALIVANDADIGVNSGNITTNTTNIAEHDVDIAANTTNITANDVDIAANTASIATKQATLTWSTVADDHDTNPVTSKEIKTYVDANAGGSGATLGANTFTASQEFKSSSNIKLHLENTTYGSALEISNNYGDSAINYVGKASITFNWNRIQFGGGCTMLGMPVVTSLDTTNASHSCLCVKDDKLYFNSNGSWKEVAFV